MFWIFGQDKKSSRVGPASSFTISDDGIDLIAQFEGLERRGGSKKYAPRGANLRQEDKNKIYMYIDPVGLPTIGLGHLLTKREQQSGFININGKNINYKNGLTMDQVMDLKRQDLKRFEDAVHRHVKVKITQSMYDALVSWLFNVGAGRMNNSTLGRKLNRKDYIGAANELPRWNKAGGRTLRGLTRRRNAERDMFLTEIEKVST